ncbi:hypothetical protein KK083_21655 [Fulvivirgaceae bacterium PWU4]|uniref:Uncharacterized protein n=2 Tax=Chryseosolibacter histidini TaxID=2782349 RepID=A0AAP2GKX5_9BACT|nr:hypothetical protein [Chryseosolibacter histidini]
MVTALMLLAGSNLVAQVYSNKEVGKKNEVLIDSIKNTTWPYALPILGKKATSAGFNLPYPMGINVNYLWQRSDIVIENLRVGFNHGPMHDLSEVIRFDDATSNANAVNIRPDFWLLPFLNIYGIFARSNPSTEVDFGIYVPDADGNWNNVLSLNTEANFNATTFGFGVTPTIGVGGGWIALDMNFTWSDIPELQDPAFATVLGPRMGKSFKFRRPDQNIAIWVGGFRLHINTGTNGSVQLNEIFPTQDLQQKVDNGAVRVEDSRQQVDTWWGGLTPAEQKNPVNAAKYETANRALDAAGRFINSLDQALNDEQYASVQYSLDKRQKNMWNFIVGSQYQYNKHWMLRLEIGFFGSRQQLLGGLQYRFGI